MGAAEVFDVSEVENPVNLVKRTAALLTIRKSGYLLEFAPAIFRATKKRSLRFLQFIRDSALANRRSS